MRATGVDEKVATLESRQALGGENLVEYSIFLTDAFGDPSAGNISFLEGPGIPKHIDGWSNDDSYRSSRFFKLTDDKGNPRTAVDNLRESSLARQLSEKSDRSAIIRLIQRRMPDEVAAVNPMEKNVPWVNIIPPNTKFFLENVTENREEKVQVVDTFGQWVAYFFGRKPEVYSFSGTLLNAKNHDWKNEFQENYDYFLRGSEAVRRRATMVIQYDDVIVEGYMLNCQLSLSGASDKAAPFAFSLLVINRSPINPRNMIGLRENRGDISDAENQLFEDLQEVLDLANAGRIEDLQTFVLMREYFSGNYVPPSGVAVNRSKTNQVDTGESRPPGVKGGVATNDVKSSAFNAKQSSAVRRNGVTIVPPPALDF